MEREIEGGIERITFCHQNENNSLENKTLSFHHENGHLQITAAE
jgi:hypothetical protein